MGDKENVLPASFRVKSPSNKHAVRKHAICRGKFFFSYLPLCLKNLILDLLPRIKKPPQNKQKPNVTEQKNPNS